MLWRRQIRKLFQFPAGGSLTRPYMHSLKLSYKWKKRKAEAFLCFSAFMPQPELLSLSSHDLTTIVGTASLASSVGHDGLTALGADGHAGSSQLPVGATALIAAGRGHFTLRDSHG